MINDYLASDFGFKNGKIISSGDYFITLKTADRILCHSDTIEDNINPDWKQKFSVRLPEDEEYLILEGNI